MSCNYRINCFSYLVGQSQWPRSLRRRSAADRLLGSWVRIPPGGHECLSLVQCSCCQVEVSAMGQSLVQRSPTDCGACLECDQGKINNLDTCCEQVEEGRTTTTTYLVEGAV
jgi:hypothetical protein